MQIAPGLLEGVLGGGDDTGDVWLSNITSVADNPAYQYPAFEFIFHADGTVDEGHVELKRNTTGTPTRILLTPWWHGDWADLPGTSSPTVQIRWNMTANEWGSGNTGTENTWITISDGLPVTNFTWNAFDEGSPTTGTYNLVCVFEFAYSTDTSTILDTFTLDLTLVVP